MKNLLALILLAPLVGGCATLGTDFAKVQAAFTVATTATVEPSTAQATIGAFEVLEAGATAYFRYCKTTPSAGSCAPGTVSQPGPLRLAIKYDRQGRAARDQIKAAGKSGALISSAVYNLLVDAVTQLGNSPVASFGVPK